MNKMESLLDIIIVNYRSTDFLFNSLKSLYNTIQDIPIQIFVQNNDEKDGLECVKSMFPDVVFSRNRYNMGFAKAINQALRQTRAPYIMLINPDTVVKSGFFDSILEYMNKHRDVGIVGPKILSDDGTVQGSARSFPNMLTAFFGRSSLLTKWFPNNRFSRANMLTCECDGQSPMEVDWVSGACLVVRRQALEEVGLLDERFFMYWEDVDWCKRMWQKGWKIVYYPKAAILHYVGGSSEKSVYHSVLEFHRSAYYFSGKHLTPSITILKPFFYCTVFVGIYARFLFVLTTKMIKRPFKILQQKPDTDIGPCR